MAFYIGDAPAQPFVIEPPDTIDLDEFDTVTAVLVDPAGGTETMESLFDEEAGAILVDIDAPLNLEGIYRLRLVLDGDGGVRMLPEIRLVVQDPDSKWHTLDTARAEWADAEHLADPVLYELLEVAKGEVLEFAPALAEDAPVPIRYRKGQLMQARNILNAAGVDPSTGDDGAGSFVIRPFPLDWQVKQTLRPKHGIPVFG
ncbi:hypothetical protein [Agromyces larvae]|uniref:Uncharacterized protein n=1 Tax=Agromyces larvae TaxID=2929802 RepID=A0ABY4BZZ7_9MICO|nr:hypothetical protein [Agromyces larvae]UOE43742.1 hypothetical protein MTO99_16460 [Agromyces larvae]